MGINGVVNKPIGFFSFAFFRPKGIKGAKRKECRNCRVEFFFFLGGFEFVAWVSYCIFFVSSIDGWFGCVNNSFAGIILEHLQAFRGFCRREGDMKKREAGAPSTLFQAFNVFGKVREMGRGEGERKNIFYYLLRCQVRIGWRKARLLRQLLTQFNLLIDLGVLV